MNSIKSIYKIGNGPSSSHTVGPYNAAMLMKERYPEADEFRVTLYGSLAMTGEGHGTKKAVQAVIPEAKVYFDKKTAEEELPHPNTMVFEMRREGREIARCKVFSIGGGSIRVEGEDSEDERQIYPQRNFTEILNECRRRNIGLAEFAYSMEGEGIKDYLSQIWQAMKDSVERGIQTEGILPGGLNITRKAKSLYEKRCYNESSDTSMNRLLAAYAYAVSEENACENVVVTAPTCGSSGVIPSVMYYMFRERGFPENEILDALAVAGIIGNVIRTNASISGAECGCQAEIGSACSMAAGALAALDGLDLDQIEYAAEVSMEHNLGLTCDPVCGLVQIPCIERNAVAAMRAFNAVDLSHFLASTRKVSFDEVIATMYQTGIDMGTAYKETSHGGLAEMYRRKTES